MNTAKGYRCIVIGNNLTEEEPLTLNIGGVRFKMTKEQAKIIGKVLENSFQEARKFGCHHTIEEIQKMETDYFNS